MKYIKVRSPDNQMSLKDRRDCDRMVVGATTTYATSTYHNYVVSSNPAQVRFTRYSIM